MENQNLPQDNTIHDTLPIVQAISVLAAGCAWSFEGDTWEGFNWMDDPAKKPSKEAIIAKAQEIQQAIPLKALRKQRDQRMKEVDWVTLRAVRTGEPMPQEWKDYMKALADITETATPGFVNGQLTNVTWPVRPDGKPALNTQGTV